MPDLSAVIQHKEEVKKLLQDTIVCFEKAVKEEVMRRNGEAGNVQALADKQWQQFVRADRFKRLSAIVFLSTLGILGLIPKIGAQLLVWLGLSTYPKTVSDFIAFMQAKMMPERIWIIILTSITFLTFALMIIRLRLSQDAPSSQLFKLSKVKFKKRRRARQSEMAVASIAKEAEASWTKEEKKAYRKIEKVISSAVAGIYRIAKKIGVQQDESLFKIEINYQVNRVIQAIEKSDDKIKNDPLLQEVSNNWKGFKTQSLSVLDEENVNALAFGKKFSVVGKILGFFVSLFGASHILWSRPDLRTPFESMMSFGYRVAKQKIKDENKFLVVIFSIILSLLMGAMIGLFSYFGMQALFVSLPFSLPAIVTVGQVLSYVFLIGTMLASIIFLTPMIAKSLVRFLNNMANPMKRRQQIASFIALLGSMVLVAIAYVVIPLVLPNIVPLHLAFLCFSVGLLALVLFSTIRILTDSSHQKKQIVKTSFFMMMILTTSFSLSFLLMHGVSQILPLSVEVSVVLGVFSFVILSLFLKSMFFQEGSNMGAGVSLRYIMKKSQKAGEVYVSPDLPPVSPVHDNSSEEESNPAPQKK